MVLTRLQGLVLYAARQLEKHYKEAVETFSLETTILRSQHLH